MISITYSCQILLFFEFVFYSNMYLFPKIPIKTSSLCLHHCICYSDSLLLVLIINHRNNKNMDSSNFLSILNDTEINPNGILKNFQENQDFNEITSFLESNNNLSIDNTGNVIDHDIDGKPASGAVVRLQRNQM